MKIKTMLIMFLAVAVMCLGLASGAYAFGHDKKGGCHGEFEGKFFHKAMMLIMSETELGLTADQVKEIKDLKIKTKKDLIKLDADIKTVGVDLEAEMWKDTTDVNAMNALIDKKYDLKKQKAKSIVAATAALDNILTAEQKTKLAELKKSCKGKGPGCPMCGGGKKGPMMGDKR